jgi:hypothetical protein
VNCQYHPIFRNCVRCGREMERGAGRACVGAPPTEPTERVKALREARALIQKHAMLTWRGGLIERSDGIAEVLVDFDLAFPEAQLP